MKESPTTLTPPNRYPQPWVDYLIQTIPAAVAQLNFEQAQALAVADFSMSDVEYAFRHLFGPRWSYVKTGLKTLATVCYRDMASFDFMRIMPLLAVFGLQPVAQPQTSFSTALQPKIEQSFMRRIRHLVRELEQKFSPGGAVNDREVQWQQTANVQDATVRQKEIETEDLLPAYYDAIEPISYYIEYCPTVSHLVGEILNKLPMRAIWMRERHGQRQAPPPLPSLAIQNVSSSNHMRDERTNEPIFPPCYCVDMNEQGMDDGGARGGRRGGASAAFLAQGGGNSVSARARLKTQWRNFVNMHYENLSMTPLMADVLRFLEHFDIKESELNSISKVLERFNYSYACAYAVLANPCSPHQWSVPNLIKLLVLVPPFARTKRCVTALLEWLRAKFTGTNMKSGQWQHQVKTKMQATFIAFSQLVVVPQFQLFVGRLVDELGHFWFFHSLESFRIVQTVLAIESDFADPSDPASDRKVVQIVVSRILNSTRKVVADAFDEDTSILRTILQECTPFRLELLNLILQHRIDNNRIDPSRGGGFLMLSGGGGRLADSSPLHGSMLGGMDPLLSPILRESSLIETLVVRYNNLSDAQLYRDSSLGRRISSIEQQLRAFLNDLLHGRAKLRVVQDVLRHRANFYRLVALLGVAPEPAALLQSDRDWSALSDEDKQYEIPFAHDWFLTSRIPLCHDRPSI